MISQETEELLPLPATSLALCPGGHGATFPATRSLFACWLQVSSAIGRAQHILLLLDFDGTLAPLCDRPEDVRLDNATRQVLRRLASNRRVTVAIVSGRRRADLRKRIGVHGLQYFGLHGWEDREGLSLSGHSQWLLLSARLWLAHRLRLRGTRLEDKEMSLAIHFRKASASVVGKLRSGVQEITEMLGPEGLHVVEGSKVLELLPPQIRGKGAAIRNIVNAIPGTPLPIYVGDDASDESAFAALPAGISIRVGRTQRRTAARYTLRDPTEVHGFLQRLEATIS